LVGPSLVDWNAHKDRIVAEVQKATGRDFSIQGDMSLSLLPVPALSAQGVRLASVEGGSSTPMVELKELRVRIALLPLLEGTVQVERILLVEPKILLEVLPDGRRNWSFANGSADAGDSIGPGASDLDVRFDDVSIENGTLVYRDAVRGRDERIDDLNLRIVAESLRGPFAAKGSFRTYGIDGTFEGTVGRLVDAGATPFNVVVKPANEAARLQLSGAISTHPDTIAVHGRLKGEGENLARLIDVLTGGGGSWPAALEQDFAIQGEVSVDQRVATVSDLSIALGGFRLAGNMTSLLAPPFDARLTLTASQLDLDHILEARQSDSGMDGEAAASPSSAEEPKQAWVLPADASGRLELSVEALIFRGQLIRQLRVDAALSDGSLRLERAIALLPGSSDISLTGSLREADGEVEFNGHLEAASDNLRGLLQWVGADVSAVPTDRLRRMSLSGRVTGSPKQIAISDLDLRMDLSRVSGGLVIAPRKRLGFGVGLALDSINLDAYLPGEAAGAGGTVDSGQQQASEEEESSRPGLAVLDQFDANFNLRAGSVTLHGATAKDLQIDATLQRGVLEFRTARVGNLGGAEVNYVGRVDKIGSQPSLDGSLQLTVSDPVRLAPLFDLDPEALAWVPGFTGEGQITGNLEELALDAQISGAGGRVEVSGTLRPAARPLAFDLRLTGQHPNLAALLEMAGRSLPSGSDLGVLDLGLRITGDPGKFRVSELEGALGPVNLTGGLAVALDGAGPALSDLDVLIDAKHPDAGQLVRLVGLTQGSPSGLGSLEVQARLYGGPAQLRLDDFEASVGPVQLSGAVDLSLDGLTPTLESYDLNVAARHPDLAGLASGFGLGTGSEGSLGGLDLSARVQGDRGRMEVKDLSGNLGPVDLSGRISVDLGGARPAFVADLETGDLPLDVLLLGMAGDGTSDGGADDSERWSREAIDLTGLRTFDARVNLRAAALTHGTLRVDQVGLSVNLTAGLLDLERFAGTVHGGAVQLAGKVDLREEIAVGLAITAIEVDLGDLLQAQAGFDRIAGSVFINGDFTTRGMSEAELVSKLEGTAKISGLLTFKSEPGEEAGSVSPDLQGSTDLPDLLVRALGRDPVRLAGNLKAEAGYLRTEDIRLDGQPAYALILATADLTGWTLDSVTDIYERSTGQPLISSIAYGGPLDAPELEHLELPPSPVPEVQEQLEPDVQEQPVPDVQEQSVPSVQEQSVPDVQEQPVPNVQEQPVPLVSETAAPEPAIPEAGEEAGAAAPSEAEPVSPEAAPQPASPAAPQPDDLLKDLLKLGG
jgi:uncharacterized protein involved in outer membrane biogenesis